MVYDVERIDTWTWQVVRFDLDTGSKTVITSFRTEPEAQRYARRRNRVAR